MRALVGASSVHPVVRVTGNFASECPLHPAAREALLAAFDQGWADPKKLSQSSAKAAILRNQALENIAEKLAIPASSIEVLGEPSLGHFLSIKGLAVDGSPLVYSAIDKGKIRAIARSHSAQVRELPVSPSGEILQLHEIPSDALFSYQLANGETGIYQKSVEQVNSSVRIAVDATASGPRLPLPPHWDTALFDSLSWRGPSGLAIMAIRDRSQFAYPLPRIAPISSPGSYSLPLLIAASIALEQFEVESSSLRDRAIAEFATIAGIEVVAPDSPSLPHLLSIVISGVTGERLVRLLAAQGIDVDSGSACSPEDLQPSHVLAAMGYETTGHVRFTFHPETSQDDLTNLISAVRSSVEELRR